MEQRPIDELFDALGGTVAVAKLLNVVPSAVSNARAQGRIPEKWKWVIGEELRRRKIYRKLAWILAINIPASVRPRSHGHARVARQAVAPLSPDLALLESLRRFVREEIQQLTKAAP